MTQTTPKTDPLIDQVLESRYRVDAQIGKGGAGIVYRGTDLTLGREVAIKTLHSADGSQESLNDFIKEARALAQIDHPKIVPIYAIGQHDGCHYLVMKFLEGETLEQRLKHARQLTVAQVRDLIQQSCEALQALHQRGLIHRDLKPANIMMAPSGQITVMDLGIAKQEDKEANLGFSLVGTPKYMPPETLSNLPIDGRSDIYSLGVIAYQALCGVVPFDGATSMAILYKQAHEKAIPIKQFVNQAPSNLTQAIEIAMEKDPNSRFQTPMDFANAVSPEAKIIIPGEQKSPISKYLILMLIGGLIWLLISQLTQDPKKNIGLKDLNEQKLNHEIQAQNQQLNQNQQTTPPQNPINQNQNTENKNNTSQEDKNKISKIKISIDSQPIADVYEGGSKVGKTPFSTYKNQSTGTVKYTIKQSGFTSKDIYVPLKQSFSTKVVLESSFDIIQ